MTRDEVNSTLRMMEHVRELSYEAETIREEKRLTREYGKMWKAIEPYVSGRVPYTAPTMFSRDDAGMGAAGR